jgi:hypothetical protein
LVFPVLKPKAGCAVVGAGALFAVVPKPPNVDPPPMAGAGVHVTAGVCSKLDVNEKPCEVVAGAGVLDTGAPVLTVNPVSGAEDGVVPNEKFGLDDDPKENAAVCAVAGV